VEEGAEPEQNMPVWFIFPFVLTELIVNISSTIMFVIPLWKTKKDLAKTLGDEHKRKTQKLMFVGSKMFVLCATASFTLLLFLYGAVNQQLAGWLTIINLVGDSICMVLISPYLSGNNHCLYTTLCRPSIYCCWCCGAKYSLLYVSFKEEPWTGDSTVKVNESTKKTVDTMSAPRVYANELETAGSPYHVPQVTPLPAISPEVTPAPPSPDDMQQIELQDVATDSAKVSQDLEVNKDKADENPITPASE